MNHQDYIDRRSAKDPEFRQEFAIATAELKLATAIAQRRMAAGITTGELAERAGVPKDRLEAIEEGDDIKIHEVLRIADALDLAVGIEPEFRLSATPVAHMAV